MSMHSDPDALMSREEADQALEHLTERQQRIADSLVSDVEGHRGLAHLKAHAPTGRTLDVWNKLEPRVALFGAQYKVLADQIQEATRVHERRDRLGNTRLAELTRLLRDPLVSLGLDGMPVERGTAAQKVTLDALCDRLSVLCGEIVPRLTEIEQASDSVAQHLSRLGSELGQLRSRSASLGMPPGPDLEHNLATYTELSPLALRDPLGMDDSGPGTPGQSVSGRLRRLEEDVLASGRRLAALQHLKQSFPERMAALRSFLGEVATFEKAAISVHTAVTAKIAKVDLPPYTGQVDELLTSLAAIERAARAPRWPDVADLLPPLERTARAALDAARAHAADANTHLAARDELRHRLDGYRVKADRLGIGEDSTLTEVYRKARDVLWTAPCDLTVATELIWQYQELVAEPPAGEKDMTP